MVSLPEDAADPMIININASELMPTAMIALMGEDLSQLQTLAEDEIAPALERIDGVHRYPSAAETRNRSPWRLTRPRRRALACLTAISVSSWQDRTCCTPAAIYRAARRS